MSIKKNLSSLGIYIKKSCGCISISYNIVDEEEVDEEVQEGRSKERKEEKVTELLIKGKSYRLYSLKIYKIV